MLRINLRKTYGFWISLPIYLSAGIVVYTFILYVIGLVVFNELTATLLALGISVLFLGDMLLSSRRSGTSVGRVLSSLKQIDLRKLNLIAKPRSKLIPVLVFVVSLLYLTIVVAIFEWPPAGDIISHGFYTSLIIYDQRIPASFYPFVSWSLFYPLGLHASAANLALLLGIYPGEAVLLFGGILMIALTSLVFSLTFILTRSRLLSLSAYMLTYLTYTPGSGGGDLEKWIFGYLFNGPYPNLYGFLIVLLSITVVVILGKTKDPYIVLRLYPILMIVLLLSYPSFIFAPVLLFVFAILQVGLRKALRECFRTKRDTLLTIILLIATIYFVLYVYLGVYSAQMQAGGIFAAAYVIPQSYILGSIFGYSIIFAFAFSLFLIAFSFVKKNGYSTSLFGPSELVELRPVLLIHVTISMVLFLSLNPWFYQLTQYTLPGRLAMVAMMFSLALNVYALSKVFGTLIPKLYRFLFVERDTLTFIQKLRRSSAKRRVHRINPRKNLSLANKMGVILALLVFFNFNGLLIYSAAAQGSFSLANAYAWNSHTAWFDDDFRAMEWICTHTTHGELILNDWSWDGMYITSLAALNVTMQYTNAGFNRTTDLQLVWTSPTQPAVWQQLLKRYNVSYIFSPAEYGYYDFLNDRTYKDKPYSPSMYVSLFLNYSFLELVFRSGNSAVFRIR